MDVLEMKNGTIEADSSDILFVLIDLYKSVLLTLISFNIFIFKFLSFGDVALLVHNFVLTLRLSLCCAIERSTKSTKPFR